MGYMSNGLTFNTLRQANSKRLVETAKFQECKEWSVSDWFLALTGELGEAANLYKKIKRGDFSLDDKREELGNELADVMIYLDLLAKHVGVDLAASVESKFNIVSKRVGSNIILDGDDWRYYPPIST